jgi:DNA-binding FadR family transcriptional regulator
VARQGVRRGRSNHPAGELVALQGIGTGVMRHALEALAADGLILVRRGQTAIVAGNPGSTPQGTMSYVAQPRDTIRHVP